MFTPIYFDMGTCFYMCEQKKKHFQKFIYKYGKKLGDDIINSHICKFMSTVQENLLFHISLIFHPIFIKFSLFFFYSFILYIELI